LGSGQPTPTPRRYEKLAEEGFQKNAVVFRCVNLVSECAAAVPWTLFRRRGIGKERLDVHPLLTLLERPNPTQGGAAFFKAVYAFRLLSGNSYIEAVGPSDGANAGWPRELWTLRPDRIQIVKGDKGQPAGFQFQAGGRTVTWRVDPVTGQSPVLHSKSFHPLDDWYGMSPLEAAAFEVDQHNAAGAWNYALLQNSGRPSGALVYDPGEGRHSDVLDGEFVVNAQAARDHRRLLEWLNADMPVPAYATGGAVPPFLRYVSADVRPPSSARAAAPPREPSFAGRPVVVHIHNPTSVAEIQRSLPKIRGRLREMLARAERRGE